ncbi:MAG: 2-oxoacid:ferredoxin oxidoreductase subunit beta [Planctomycetes bacterium]|jgi:2-oxoglutarate ferredoxin oxidoreductase subunit beta|nr:2-oxoacid:ferredoxin oxidoreductase subunit beta [Planctomycetota bacterium]
MTAAAPTPEKLTKKDYRTDQEIRWCPGCGDYAILNAVQQAFAEMGVNRDNVAIVSGIGCSSRFPYYMETYGFHTIHGRAPAVATGLKVANPDLDVWVMTGDGDGLSIGGNHLIHLLRRDVGVKVLMFNNRIYGLTKGQYSPTSEQGKVTKSTPIGSPDAPFNPLALAIGAGATFVARTVDIMGQHIKDTIRAAAAHDGTAFIEVLQNCNIFNDKAFEPIVDRKVRDDQLVSLEKGEPLVFGKDEDQGLVWDRLGMRVVKLDVADPDGKTWTKDDLVVWDPTDSNPTLAFAMAHLRELRDPTPIGILRQISDIPNYETIVHRQIEKAREKSPDRTLEQLIYSGNTWEVG